MSGAQEARQGETHAATLWEIVVFFVLIVRWILLAALREYCREKRITFNDR